MFTFVVEHWCETLFNATTDALGGDLPLLDERLEKLLDEATVVFNGLPLELLITELYVAPVELTASLELRVVELEREAPDAF